MKRGEAFPFHGSVAVMCLLLLGLALPAPSADETDPNAVPETAQTNVLGPVTNQVAEQEVVTADKAWRSFLQIQGQIDNALLAIERTRREGEATALDNQKKINDNLKSIEKVLQAQQEHEVLALRESNHNMLIVAGAFAGVGFLAMLLTSFFHLRAMNRLAGIATAFPMAPHVYGPGPASLLSSDEERLLATPSGPSAGQRLLQALEKLERRVIDLEHTSHLPGQTREATTPAEVDNQFAAAEVVDAGPGRDEAALPGPQERMSMLVGKGQALLSLGKAEEALVCFDQALDLQPDHAEILVKKGSALEKLNRLDEAIECYDRAIAANNSMTLAYLYKGGLFNRMERFNEALACYELALKTQQHPDSSKVELEMKNEE
jgi:tetratricopeptide (TPR) repeat protein